MGREALCGPACQLGIAATQPAGYLELRAIGAATPFAVDNERVRGGGTPAGIDVRGKVELTVAVVGLRSPRGDAAIVADVEQIDVEGIAEAVHLAWRQQVIDGIAHGVEAAVEHHHLGKDAGIGKGLRHVLHQRVAVAGIEMEALVGYAHVVRAEVVEHGYAQALWQGIGSGDKLVNGNILDVDAGDESREKKEV